MKQEENTLENAKELSEITYELTKLARGSTLKALGMSVLIQDALIQVSKKEK